MRSELARPAGVLSLFCLLSMRCYIRIPLQARSVLAGMQLPLRPSLSNVPWGSPNGRSCLKWPNREVAVTRHVAGRFFDQLGCHPPENWLVVILVFGCSVAF